MGVELTDKNYKKLPKKNMALKKSRNAKKVKARKMKREGVNQEDTVTLTVVDGEEKMEITPAHIPRRVGNLKMEDCPDANNFDRVTKMDKDGNYAPWLSEAGVRRLQKKNKKKKSIVNNTKQRVNKRAAKKKLIDVVNTTVGKAAVKAAIAASKNPQFNKNRNTKFLKK